MSDREALLAAIKAFPDEDTPRLVYADWLDEHGESERAALIRYSCSPRFANRRTAEFRRAQRIAKRYFPVETFRTYFAPRDCEFFEVKGFATVAEAMFQLSPDACLARVLFDRGFVVAVVCSANQWLAHAAAILAEHPVRRVRLTDRTTGNSLAILGIDGVATKALLSARWPGIEFELPPPVPAYQFSGVIWNWAVSTKPVTGGSIPPGTGAAS